MGRDDEREQTPPTGTAVPRPRRLQAVDPPGYTVEPLPLITEPQPAQPVDVVDFARLPSSPPPPLRPVNPTLDDIYALIDRRLSPVIMERISSAPPAATVQPRPSIPVRAAKATGRYGRGFMTIMGGVLLVLQGVAWVEEYRGPIQQGVAIVGKLIGLWEASRVVNEPEPIGE